MNKDSFKSLFEKSLEAAAIHAESKLERSVPRTFEVELHGGGYSGILLTPDETLEILYLGEDRSYRIIDIGVIAIFTSHTRVFVRISAHTPSTFDKTWNQLLGNGPFKQILAQELSVKKD